MPLQTQRVCGKRDRSMICPIGTTQNGYTVIDSKQVNFNPLGYLNIEYVNIPRGHIGASTSCDALIAAHNLPWWHPDLDFNGLINITGNGAIGTIPDDDLADNQIQVLTKVNIHLRFEQDVETRQTNLGLGAGMVYTDFGPDSDVVSTGVVCVNGDFTLYGDDGVDLGILIDGKNFDLSAALTGGECWKVDQDPVFAVQVQGDSRTSVFTPNPGPFNGPCAGRYQSVVKSNTHIAIAEGYYVYETWQFNCKPTVPPKCPGCPGCGLVPSALCQAFCVTGITGIGRGQGTWTITDANGHVVGTDKQPNGWRVIYNYDCTITVCAPCIKGDPSILQRFHVDFQDTAGTAVGNCFDVIPQPECPQTGNFSAVEMDSPKMWLHVGRGQGVSTYSQPDNVFQFGGGGADVDKWLRLRIDGRENGALAMLGQVEKTATDGTITRTFSVWTSGDGGQTTVKVKEMAGQSSLIERDPERGYLLWWYTDSTNQVSLRQSKDWQTFDDEIAVMLDGKRMQGTLLDSCQDGRNNGRIALVIAPGADPLKPAASSKVVFSGDAGESFTTGLT